MSSWLSAKFTLSSCQNLPPAEGTYFGGEYGDDPFNLVCYGWWRLQATFLAKWDVPSRISFACYQPPSASNPSSCSSLARVTGWFMIVPSARIPRVSPPRWVACSAWGIPGPIPLGETCHLPSTHVSVWDGTVHPSQPSGGAAVRPPAPGLLGRLTGVSGLPFIPPQQCKAEPFRQNQLPTAARGLMLPPQPAPCRRSRRLQLCSHGAAEDFYSLWVIMRKLATTNLKPSLCTLPSSHTLSPPELLRDQDFAVEEFAAQREGAALSPSRERCILQWPRKSPPK